MLSDNFHQLKDRIHQAAINHSRAPDAIKLLAVSKQQSITTIRNLLALGQHDFGENYLQEALPKILALNSESITWHFIGHIQANKTALIARHFSWVQSVDRLKIAQRLSAARGQYQLPDLQICLQVNALQSSHKTGISLSELPELIKAVTQLPYIKLRGLMTLPDSGTEEQAFTAVASIFSTLRQQGYAMDVLSMGMSVDLEMAIAAGATMVRVGSALFGARS